MASCSLSSRTARQAHGLGQSPTPTWPARHTLADHTWKAKDLPDACVTLADPANQAAANTTEYDPDGDPGTRIPRLCCLSFLIGSITEASRVGRPPNNPCPVCTSTPGVHGPFFCLQSHHAGTLSPRTAAVILIMGI